MSFLQPKFYIFTLFFFNLFQSSLLSAVLGELPKDSGLINVTGRIAYVSQQPWVFSGTVRSNILFDKEYEKEKYENVLKVCALKKVRLSLCVFSFHDGYFYFCVLSDLWYLLQSTVDRIDCYMQHVK